jgi:putative ABC transport system substrate-binding protein
MSQVRRRQFLIASGALLAAPLIRAQQQAKVWRIALLEPSQQDARAHLVKAFIQRLQELGYEEGRNSAIEMRFANGNLEKLPALASELVRLKVDVIVASTTPSINAARKATKAIPIVMATVGDPVEAGFVASFARPGGNITGLTTQAPELMAKRVQLIKQAVPKLTRLAVLWDSRNTHEVQGFKEATAAGRKLGISLQPLDVRGQEEIEVAFATMARGRANGLMVFENAINNSARTHIVDLAKKYRLPGIYPFRDFAEDGGFMSYGAMIIDNYRQAAVYVDKILRGAKAADLPVQQPTKFELIINRKAGKVLGLSIPQSLLISADEVIE